MSAMWYEFELFLWGGRGGREEKKKCCVASTVPIAGEGYCVLMHMSRFEVCK